MNRAKLCLAILVLFCSGVVFGVVGSMAYVHHSLGAFHRAGPTGIHKLGAHLLDWNLKLSREQEAQVNEILHEVHTEFFEFSSHHHEVLHEIIGRAVVRIEAILNESQEEEWAAIRNRLEQHMRTLASGEMPGAGTGHHRDDIHRDDIHRDDVQRDGDH